MPPGDVAVKHCCRACRMARLERRLRQAAGWAVRAYRRIVCALTIRPRHSAASVVRRLYEGLRDGTVRLKGGP